MVASNYVVRGVKGGSSQTIINNSTNQIVTFVDDVDPNNWLASNKITPTVAGYYNITTHVWWDAGVVTNNQNNIQIQKNGSQVAIDQTQILSGNGYAQELNTIVYLNGTTDYIEITAYTGNTTSQIINGSSNGTYVEASLIVGGASSNVPGSNNQMLTSNGSGSLVAESNLEFDGVSLRLLASAGDEGGEIFLSKSVTNTSINTGVTLDVYQNKVRLFESGGTNRGGYWDITSLGAGVSTNLAAGGGGSGSSGSSGTSGSTGSSGTSGSTGSSGTSGSTGSSGTSGSTGSSGTSGSTGSSGTSGSTGAGVPVGGTSGQVLAKIDATNYNTQWVDTTGGATITNYGNNRVITSDGTTTGLVGETNMTFDGSMLNVTGSMKLSGTFSGANNNYVTGDAITQTILLYLSNNC